MSNVKQRNFVHLINEFANFYFVFGLYFCGEDCREDHLND